MLSIFKTKHNATDKAVVCVKSLDNMERDKTIWKEINLHK